MVERGTHEELLATGGQYARMWALQLRGNRRGKDYWTGVDSCGGWLTAAVVGEEGLTYMLSLTDTRVRTGENGEEGEDSEGEEEGEINGDGGAIDAAAGAAGGSGSPRKRKASKGAGGAPQSADADTAYSYLGGL